MGSEEIKLDIEFTSFLRIYKNGKVDRLLGTESTPPGTDSKTGVFSKDVENIIAGTEVYVRIYLPSTLINTNKKEKVPVVLYFHGGGFCFFTPSSPLYHNYLNSLVSQSNVIVVSVHPRRAPEHPLPVAYEDSLATLQWVASHRNGDGPDTWLNNHADFRSVFLAGDSSGANIAHNVAMAVGKCEEGSGVDVLQGIALVHPYFWGKVPTEWELNHPENLELKRKWWPFVCPARPDTDDPWINPVAEGAPSLKGLGCKRVLICVTEKDMAKERGLLYHRGLSRSAWSGLADLAETEGEDHVFHLYNPESVKAKDLMKRMAIFFNG